MNQLEMLLREQNEANRLLKCSYKCTLQRSCESIMLNHVLTRMINFTRNLMFRKTSSHILYQVKLCYITKVTALSISNYMYVQI